MRIFGLAAGLLILSGPANALPENQNLVQWGKYVPSGWKAIGVAQGKLSAKSNGDAVLIAEENDPAKRKVNDDMGNPSINVNPRRLIFLTKAQQGYRQTHSYDGFLPTEGNAQTTCLADPLEEGGIDIAKNVFSVTLHYWLSCGSYGVTTRTFKFRSKNGAFRLIGMDSLSFSRSTGEGSEISINYLTGKKKYTTGIEVIGPNEPGDTPYQKKIKWSRTAPTPYYLSQMKQTDCDDYENGPSWCTLE